jgi:hypothetical protein
MDCRSAAKSGCAVSLAGASGGHWTGRLRNHAGDPRVCNIRQRHVPRSSALRIDMGLCEKRTISRLLGRARWRKVVERLGGRDSYGCVDATICRPHFHDQYG